MHYFDLNIRVHKVYSRSKYMFPQLFILFVKRFKYISVITPKQLVVPITRKQTCTEFISYVEKIRAHYDENIKLNVFTYFQANSRVFIREAAVECSVGTRVILIFKQKQYIVYF